MISRSPELDAGASFVKELDPEAAGLGDDGFFWFWHWDEGCMLVF